MLLRAIVKGKIQRKGKESALKQKRQKLNADALCTLEDLLASREMLKLYGFDDFLLANPSQTYRSTRAGLEFVTKSVFSKEF